MSFFTQDPTIIAEFRKRYSQQKDKDDTMKISIEIMCASSNPEKPLSYSGLTSFDFGKEVGLFENDFKVTDNCVYSDRLRNYDNHSELTSKYKIKDTWYGLTVNTITQFVSDLFSKQIKITRISETINQQGYPIYIIRYTDIN